MKKKDFSLLRPFDLEAAAKGVPVCTPDGVATQLFSGDAGWNKANRRMAPLTWLEGRPVYKGDTIYPITSTPALGEGPLIVIKDHEPGVSFRTRTANGAVPVITVENCTWSAPKSDDRDYTLLRPFDLVAATHGAPVCTKDGVSVGTCDEPSNIGWNTRTLRMAPLTWLDGRPVYRDDVLFAESGDAVLVDAAPSEDDGHILCRVLDTGTYLMFRLNELSWGNPHKFGEPLNKKATMRRLTVDPVQLTKTLLRMMAPVCVPQKELDELRDKAAKYDAILKLCETTVETKGEPVIPQPTPERRYI